MTPDEHILETWHQNAGPWVKAIAEGEIESRLLVTNEAIMQTVLSLTPARVWDIGCGEGWLCRSLAENGINCTGTDAIPALVDAAIEKGGGRFEVLAYTATTTEKALKIGADLFLFNFSLFGAEQVFQLLQKLQPALPANGHLVIQTLHPFTACGEAPYESGWREGSWAGFSQDFVNPAPWYFRTVGDWVKMLVNTDFRVIEVKEPLHPKTGKPLSLIITAAVN
jgi:SAM-dependent methyltransferase